MALFLGFAWAQAPETQPSFIDRFSSEANLTVTTEQDGLIPGKVTLRSALFQAAGLRHNNSFQTVKITFEPDVKRVRVVYGNLPAVEEGFTTIDCAQQVILDGFGMDPGSLNEGETAAGLVFKSNGNILKGCEIAGFKGPGVIVAGNQNQILNNTFGHLLPKSPLPKPPTPGIGNMDDLQPNEGAGLFLDTLASENLIEQNRFFGNRQEGISVSAQAGVENKWVSNEFQGNAKKPIHNNEGLLRTPRALLKPIVKDGEDFLISGTLSEPGQIEVYYSTPTDSDEKLIPLASFTSTTPEFVFRTKDKGFVANVTKIFVLATALERNTSEFSESVLIPDITKTLEPSPALPEAPKETPIPEPKPEIKNPSPTEEEPRPLESPAPKPLNEHSDSALQAGSTSTYPSPVVSDLKSELEILPMPSHNFITPPVSSTNSRPQRSTDSDTIRVDVWDEF